jgi:hypothetical protein
MEIQDVFSEELSIKTRPTKNEGDKRRRKTFDLQNSLKEVTDLARIRSKFPRGAKLDAFTVIYNGRDERKKTVALFSFFFCVWRSV